MILRSDRFSPLAPGSKSPGNWCEPKCRRGLSERNVRESILNAGLTVVPNRCCQRAGIMHSGSGLSIWSRSSRIREGSHPNLSWMSDSRLKPPFRIELVESHFGASSARRLFEKRLPKNDLFVACWVDIGKLKSQTVPFFFNDHPRRVK